MGMRLTRVLAAGCVLMAAAGGAVAMRPEGFWKLLGAFLVADEQITAPDAVLVLGGDFLGPRVVEGARLGHRGVAPLVVISGPPYHERYECDLAIDYLSDKHGFRRELFTGIRHRARNTLGEAALLRPELARLGFRRILLVTSNYHSRRALAIFRAMVPGVEFGMVPAVDPHFEPARWWLVPAQRQIVKRELASLAWNLTAGRAWAELGFGP